MHLFSLFTSLFSHLYTFLLDFENLVLRHGFQFQCGFHHPSIHPDTLRSVRHAHNSVASTKRHYSYQAQVSVRRTQFVVKSPSSSGGTSIEAWLHRGAAHNTAYRVAKAANDGFALVETESEKAIKQRFQGFRRSTPVPLHAAQPPFPVLHTGNHQGARDARQQIVAVPRAVLDISRCATSF